jgi:hypothetical protein
MPECGDAMARNSRLSILVSLSGVLQGLPGRLVSRQMLRASLLLGNAMGMRGDIM